MRTNTSVFEDTVMALVMEALVGTPGREFVPAGVSVEEAGVGEEGVPIFLTPMFVLQELPRPNQCSVHPFVENICSLPST
jgi:hypothetical protein